MEVQAVKQDLIEIQSLDVAAVVERKAADAYAKVYDPVLVDDTGLTLSAWNGLPSALVAWLLDSVGTQGILDMTANLTDRAATVTTAVRYADSNGIQVVTGTLQGTLATEQRGANGFGYDEIFIPAGGNLTFTEMPSEQKSLVSHRRLAVDALRTEPELATAATPTSSAPTPKPAMPASMVPPVSAPGT
nr:non-canonical purine NTP pyrophosphatase [Pseudofrankia asymbiotica]